MGIILINNEISNVDFFWDLLAISTLIVGRSPKTSNFDYLIPSGKEKSTS
jgi:hypothetical protein